LECCKRMIYVIDPSPIRLPDSFSISFNATTGEYEYTLDTTDFIALDSGPLTRVRIRLNPIV
jgi:hypothetical protein